VISELNPEKCRIDSYYIETAQFSADLKILIDTLFGLGRQSQHRLSPRSLCILRQEPSITSPDC